jgi:hypothetical protein
MLKGWASATDCRDALAQAGREASRSIAKFAALRERRGGVCPMQHADNYDGISACDTNPQRP